MAAASPPGGAPRLVVTNPQPVRGLVLELDKPRLTLGRDERADLQLPQPEVSRKHARFERAGGEVTVSDLGSTNGTLVNGARLSQPRSLQHGDVLRFAGVEARFESPSGDATGLHSAGAAGDHSIEHQSAGWINNVDGAQYNYIKQVTQQRESFLREVAATKTKARRLVWLGFVLFVLGGGTYFWVFARAASSISRFIASPPSGPDAFEAPLPELFGTDVGGIALGVLGIGVAALGVLLMGVGLVLHVVAAARRRRLEAPAVAPFVAPAQAARP